MKTLFDAFSESAQAHAERTALIDFQTGQRVTYATLAEQAAALAAQIRTTCLVTPGDRVGMLMLNQIEFVVSFLALQALGCVVIPLSYRLSTPELRAILEDAGASGLMAGVEFEETYRSLLPELAWHAQVDASGDWAITASPISLSPAPQERVPNLAVLIYTSGTTGKPKGVMLSHRNMLADVAANTRAIEACGDDIFVTVSPLFHVFGLVNILLTALLQGASLVLVRRFHPKTILEAITEHRVTFMAAVPTMYQMMLTLLPSESYDLRSLRVCHSGAAPMPTAVFHHIEAAFGAPVQEGYGQSEASSIVTSNPLYGLRKPGSIGKALHGLTVQIVDEDGCELPPGEIGELRVYGDTVMLGYWRQPDLTAHMLRDGWLYTSDMGSMDGDGYITLEGRRDDLINTGGAKVYPREVEEVLYRHPAVQSCAVCAEPSELYYQTVVAYIVLHPSEDVSASALQAWCRDHLAEYKVPKAIHFVPEIPKGPTGKILRYQLKPHGTS